MKTNKLNLFVTGQKQRPNELGDLNVFVDGRQRRTKREKNWEERKAKREAQKRSREYRLQEAREKHRLCTERIKMNKEYAYQQLLKEQLREQCEEEKRWRIFQLESDLEEEH